MNYGEVKREALKLIFQDTIAGEDIADTYNNQADYVKMIPSLVDSAQMDIVVRAKKIPAIASLDSLPVIEEGDFNVYQLPFDCQDLMHGGLIWMHKNSYGEPDITRYHGYKFIGGRLFVPNNVSGKLSVEYWRYPVSVGAEPKDTQPLDNTEDTHAAIPYYVAAHMVMYDDAFRYSALRNEYETKLSMLKNPVFVEDSRVEDVYGFGGYGGF